MLSINIEKTKQLLSTNSNINNRLVSLKMQTEARLDTLRRY